MPFIQDELNRVMNQTESSGVDWCVTLESKKDANKWVQLTWDHVNLHYPINEPPSETLGQIGWPDGNLDLNSWEAGLFVTFSHGGNESIPETAEFVRRYMEVVLDENSIADDWTVSEEAL